MTEIKIDRIIRSRRRTVALVITEDAALEVRAPLRASWEFIQNMIAKKRAWIQKKQEFVRNHRFNPIPKDFIDGASLMYLGKMHKLQFDDRDDILLHDVLEALYFPRQLAANAKQHLISWYQKQALAKIVERVEWYASATGLRCRSVRIGNAKKRWGSCTAKGALNFTWRLIMAPLSVIDYVVVHELVHLIEKNHAKKFWRRVGEILPDYKQQNYWLKQNGSSLVI